MTGTCTGRTGRLATLVEACRPDLMFYAGLVSLAGAVLAAGDWVPWRFFGAWAAAILGWCAAMYGGDYFDRNLDSIAKPHRPIPSGRMTPATAFAGMVVGIVLGTVVAVALNPRNLVIVALATVLGVAYSGSLKARGLSGSLARGGISALAFLLGTMSTSTVPPLVLAPFAFVFLLHDAASNVLGAICDAEGDRAGGYRTVPVRYGEPAALRIMVMLHLLWLALAVGYPPLVEPPLDLVAYYPFVAVAAVLALVSAGMVLRTPRPIPRLAALRAHEVLVVERLILAAALLAAAGETWLAVVVLVPSVAGTLLSSLAMMRQRYEPSRRRKGTDHDRSGLAGTRGEGRGAGT